jgi:hypothetical protein
MLEGLQATHRRLEQACQRAPFLPADPASACCPEMQLRSLIDETWPALAQALTIYGARHQWDLAVRWTPETVLTTQRATLADIAARGDAPQLASAVATVLRQSRERREHLLSAALSEAALGLMSASAAVTETELMWTVLLPRQGEGAIEAALMAIPSHEVSGVEVDLKGPMPPVSFHAVRVILAEQADIARSWRLLELPERVDTDALHRQWRALAALSHPDRVPNDPDGTARFTSLGAAYRLLRPQVGARSTTLRALLRQNGYRIEVPEVPVPSLHQAEVAA